MSESDSLNSSWLKAPGDFLHGLTDPFVEDWHGIKQAFGSKDKDAQPAAENNNSWWRSAGNLVGRVAEFGIVNEGFGAALAPLKATRAAIALPPAQMGLAGATTDLLKPVDPSDSLGTAKLHQGLMAFGTYATMGTTSQAMSQVGLFGRIGHRTLTDSMLANGVAGATGGIANVGLDSWLNGKDAHWSTIAEQAAFGTVFGALDWKLGAAKLKLPKTSNTPEGLPSTEDLVLNNYDTTRPLRSPILTWMAENRPQLRPPNYDAARKQLLTDGKDLDLALWPPEQRAAIVTEARKLAGSSIAGDENIDAFIGRFKQLDRDIFVPGEREYTHWVHAYQEVLRAGQRIAPDAKLADLVSGKDPRGNDHQFATPLRWASEAEDSWQSAPKDTTRTAYVQKQLSTAFNDISRSMGLPKTNLELMWTSSADGTYGLQNYQINAHSFRGPLSTEFMDAAFHENRHHLQGTLDWGGLLRFAGLGSRAGRLDSDQLMKRSTLVRELIPTLDREGSGLTLAKELDTDNRVLRYALWSKDLDVLNFNRDVLFNKQGTIPRLPKDIADLVARAKAEPSPQLDTEIRDKLRPLFETQADELMGRSIQSLHRSYVGTAHEKQAFASGLLASIRARAWGLPDVRTEGSEPSWTVPQSLSRERDSYTAHINREIDRATGKLDTNRFWTHSWDEM